LIASDDNIINVDQKVKDCCVGLKKKERIIRVRASEVMTEKRIFKTVKPGLGACFRPYKAFLRRHFIRMQGVYKAWWLMHIDYFL
jgi:hypothetical protein